WAIDVYGSLLTKYFRTGEIDMNEVHPYISEGFGEDFVPKNYDMSVIDHFEQVTDRDGAIMTRRLAKEEGMFCGYSSGSTLQGLYQLKKELKKGDVVVVLLCDHGSRYVSKVYNDQWMAERGFLEVKSFRDIVLSKVRQPLITIENGETVAHAVNLMKEFDIEHIPVTSNGDIVGSISESGLFQKLFNNPEIKNEKIEAVLENSFPLVAFDAPVEKLGVLINKENGAVLAKDESGNYHIVTKYDVLQALT
ncbi:MAG TPA: pyridoxal-phosphate dependent enzyme, partial [Chitinophagaceae bacterium]|nr:pyridoxal-phosphate dependent enzyme [Chitinophagaceae bacterium]